MGAVSPLEASDLVFSGTAATGGEARAIVLATGMQTELGRVAALTQRVEPEESPLQQQVRRVAWLIALIAVVVGIAFVPLGTLVAGLSLTNAIIFAIGLLVANVPEGLLPTITLALAVGVRQLVRRGALVKRLSAVETLGSTDVICTDKTGTLTQNRMQAKAVWPDTGEVARAALAEALAHCSNAERDPRAGDPTELALLDLAAELGVERTRSGREAQRRAVFGFDPSRKLMTTIDELADGWWAHVKGAPDILLERCDSWIDETGMEVAMTARDTPADRCDQQRIRVAGAARPCRSPAPRRRRLARSEPRRGRDGAVLPRPRRDARPSPRPRCRRRWPTATPPGSASSSSPEIIR